MLDWLRLGLLAVGAAMAAIWFLAFAVFLYEHSRFPIGSGEVLNWMFCL